MKIKAEPTFYVYAIAWSPRGPSKVGITNTLIPRLEDLQVGCPFRLQIYGAFAVKSQRIAVTVERKILDDLAPFRMLGEWLKVNPNVLRQVVEAAAKTFDLEAKPWKPTEQQRAERIINLQEFARRRARQRDNRVLADAETLDILIRNS